MNANGEPVLLSEQGSVTSSSHGNLVRLRDKHKHRITGTVSALMEVSVGGRASPKYGIGGESCQQHWKAGGRLFAVCTLPSRAIKVHCRRTPSY